MKVIIVIWVNDFLNTARDKKYIEGCDTLNKIQDERLFETCYCYSVVV